MDQHFEQAELTRKEKQQQQGKEDYNNDMASNDTGRIKRLAPITKAKQSKIEKRNVKTVFFWKSKDSLFKPSQLAFSPQAIFTARTTPTPYDNKTSLA